MKGQAPAPPLGRTRRGEKPGSLLAHPPLLRPLAAECTIESFNHPQPGLRPRLAAWRAARSSRLALVLLSVLVVLLLVVVASYVALSTDFGRARIRDRINQLGSHGMQGKLVVGEIEAIELPRVKARNVRILAPDGVAAIEVETADIDFDLASFLSGDFIWHSADIRNGTVRVTEDKRGRINMEETFRSREESAEPTAAQQDEEGELDMRTMVTSNMRLLIYGGSLPNLRLVNIHGIMRVHVLPDGTTHIRFDDYRGDLVKGLPHGQLKFHAVKGHVQTGHKRLLRFEGKGLFESEPVSFDLDIFTEPKTRAKINAYFPKLSAASLSTLGVAVGNRAIGSSVEIDVRHGK
jgi:hypothetical protein